jgi:hypothetical protein
MIWQQALSTAAGSLPVPRRYIYTIAKITTWQILFIFPLTVPNATGVRKETVHDSPPHPAYDLVLA